jgi:MFS family permease
MLATVKENWTHLVVGLPRTFWVVWTGSLINRIGNFVVPFYIQMRQQGIAPSDYGWVIAINGMLIIVLQPFVARGLSGVKPERVLSLASVLVGVGMGLNAFAKTPATYAVAVAVWTVGEVLMSPVNANIVAQLAPDNQRGRYQGLHQITFSLAFSLGPLLGGLVLEHFGKFALWGSCFVLGLLFAAMHWLIAPAREARLSGQFA